jgi:hypothetical protein
MSSVGGVMAEPWRWCNPHKRISFKATKKWDDVYFRLVQYKGKNLDMSVFQTPILMKVHHIFGVWVKNQRSYYRHKDSQGRKNTKAGIVRYHLDKRRALWQYLAVLLGQTLDIPWEVWTCKCQAKLHGWRESTSWSLAGVAKGENKRPSLSDKTK